jgi:hypothetical protein
MEEEGSYGKSLRPEDLVPDEDAQYESEEENIEAKSKEKPVGPPLELEIPLRPPPARPEKAYILSSMRCFVYLSCLSCLIYRVLAFLIKCIGIIFCFIWHEVESKINLDGLLVCTNNFRL